MKMAQFLWYLFVACIDVHLSALLPAWLQRRLCEKRLIRSIRQAYENVPFYRRKYDEAGVDIHSICSAEDIKRLPFVTKDEIREIFPKESLHVESIGMLVTIPLQPVLQVGHCRSSIRKRPLLFTSPPGSECIR